MYMCMHAYVYIHDYTCMQHRYKESLFSLYRWYAYAYTLINVRTVARAHTSQTTKTT